MTKSYKVSVNLSQEDVELLQTAARTTNRTMSEVIRHAIGLERVAQRVRTTPDSKLLVKEGAETYQLLIQ